ncbi:MAG: acyl carrier protein [Terriglobales bacterium]|jgi:acyl carrier protein
MLSIEPEIRSFIVENYLLAREDSLSNDDSFLEKGIFDSTGILELVSFVEHKYSLELEPDELVPENLDSIASLARFLQRKLDARNAIPEMSVPAPSARSGR